MTKTSGAPFEMSLDRIPRTYRDQRDLAIEVAGHLNHQNPRCEVAVTDLPTNERTVIGTATDTSWARKPH